MRRLREDGRGRLASKASKRRISHAAASALVAVVAGVAPSTATAAGHTYTRSSVSSTEPRPRRRDSQGRPRLYDPRLLRRPSAGSRGQDHQHEECAAPPVGTGAVVDGIPTPRPGLRGPPGEAAAGQRACRAPMDGRSAPERRCAGRQRRPPPGLATGTTAGRPGDTGRPSSSPVSPVRPEADARSPTSRRRGSETLSSRSRTTRIRGYCPRRGSPRKELAARIAERACPGRRFGQRSQPTSCDRQWQAGCSPERNLRHDCGHFPCASLRGLW